MAVMRALVRRSSVVRLARETTLRYLTTGSSASEDYAYHLPERLVAQQPVTWSDSAAGPAASRDASRLLCVDTGGREESNSVEAQASLRQCQFKKIKDFLPKGSFMVANDTKVVRARLQMRKKGSGGAVELLVVGEGAAEGSWVCMVKGRNIREGTELECESSGIALSATVARRGAGEDGKFAEVNFSWRTTQRGSTGQPQSFEHVLELVGSIPLPPYMRRQAEERDYASYQTVYGSQPGSVAAPTAGLHFTEDLLNEMKVRMEKVTLHVGTGTFVPLRPGSVRDHRMHTETFSVTEDALRSLCERLEYPDSERNLIAVGTTTVRTLETLYFLGLRAALMGDGAPAEFSLRQFEPYEVVRESFGGDWGALPTASECYRFLLRQVEQSGEGGLLGRTSVMIAPGYQFQCCDLLITNFHAPSTTLMLLVSAFAGEGDLGRRRVLHAYKRAVEHEFRFLSYGDACLFARFDRLPPSFLRATQRIP